MIDIVLFKMIMAYTLGVENEKLAARIDELKKKDTSNVDINELLQITKRLMGIRIMLNQISYEGET